MTREDLKIRLRLAIAERRPAALRQLLDHHGLAAFAAALAAWSPRVVADALSLLPQAERASVLRHLPAVLRRDSVCIQPVLRRVSAPERLARLQAAPSSTTHDTGVRA